MLNKISNDYKNNLNTPSWYTDKKLDEIAFADDFLYKYPMKCLNDTLFNIDGQASAENVKKLVYDEISPYIKTGVSKCVDRLLSAIKLACHVDELPIDENKIHFANGTYDLNDGFSDKKIWTMNRLPVSFNPEANAPERWISFLNEMIEADDILTLQEFLGYLLIPSTRGQKMLLILGKGGEGKSRIGVVLRKLLGNNMNAGSINKLESNQFSLADQEHKLLFLDDDIQMEALKSTHIIKSIVTAEGQTDLERKGIQSYQGRIYARLLCLGNGTLKSLYDRSYGFYRRQIIITTKDKQPDRVDDPYIGDKLVAEIDGILLWCLEGLERLIENNFAFTISDKAKADMEDIIQQENNILAFVKSDGYIIFDKVHSASSKSLYDVYAKWCDDNSEKTYSEITFQKYIKDNASTFGIEYSKNILDESGKHVRGFKGIGIYDKFKSLSETHKNKEKMIEFESDNEILEGILSNI